MARKRWIVPWNGTGKPAIYHCVSRVVDRRFAFGPDEKEMFRQLMRRVERYSGCRVLAYCAMSNHIHVLLEVTPAAEGGVDDAELLCRVAALYGKGGAEIFGQELEAARQAVESGTGTRRQVEETRARHLRRMHDLSEFMKTLLQRFTQWFNRRESRTGNLWEDKFRSVIVEDAAAARVVAAYIDLNPVRAGIVPDPGAYRWSSYGEATGKAGRREVEPARAGLARVMGLGEARVGGVTKWDSETSRAYRNLLLRGHLQGLPQPADLDETLRGRVRHFTAGGAIGSREFIETVFRASRERFGPKRTTGARRMRGRASPLRDVVWSARDLGG
ncbi:MAG: transposase [Verrucomicrobiae bacterium]|nr:transposase [Verrucomicrobiae bacterium]